MDIVGELPLEIGQYVLSYLRLSDVVACSTVSRRWYQVTNSDVLWKPLIMKYYPFVDLLPPSSLQPGWCGSEECCHWKRAVGEYVRRVREGVLGIQKPREVALTAWPGLVPVPIHSTCDGRTLALGMRPFKEGESLQHRLVSEIQLYSLSPTSFGSLLQTFDLKFVSDANHLCSTVDSNQLCLLFNSFILHYDLKTLRSTRLNFSGDSLIIPLDDPRRGTSAEMGSWQIHLVSGQVWFVECQSCYLVDINNNCVKKKLNGIFSQWQGSDLFALEKTPFVEVLNGLGEIQMKVEARDILPFMPVKCYSCHLVALVEEADQCVVKVWEVPSGRVIIKSSFDGTPNIVLSQSHAAIIHKAQLTLYSLTGNFLYQDSPKSFTSLKPDINFHIFIDRFLLSSSSYMVESLNETCYDMREKKELTVSQLVASPAVNDLDFPNCYIFEHVAISFMRDDLDNSHVVLKSFL